MSVHLCAAHHSPRSPAVRSGHFRSLSLAAAVLFLAAGGAGAQTGTITGQVLDSRTSGPLTAVQIVVPGTGAGGLSNANGNFTLTGVPAGTHSIRAERLGYQTAEASVTVVAGETAQVSFSLEQRALALDEVVVTGAAGAARRREVAHSVAEIRTTDILEPVVSTDALLQGRVAGLESFEAGGGAGAGSRVRLRGVMSVGMSNRPLIYVDGVRIMSEPYPPNNPPAGRFGRGNNLDPSPLGDINPNDIERIEVVKGAAATTLYGTEASAGVIQIFTKRGATGAPVWTAQVDQGLSVARPWGTDDEPFIYMEPFLRKGWRQNYSLSVAGGTERVRYFVSAAAEDQEGVLKDPRPEGERPPHKRGGDGLEGILVRANLTAGVLEDLSIDWNTSYRRRHIYNFAHGNDHVSLPQNVMRGDFNYVGSADPMVIATMLDKEMDTWIDRYITGVTLNHTPTATLSNRLTIGYDQATSEARHLHPFGYVLESEGQLSNNTFRHTTLTFDYVGSYRRELTQDALATFSLGAQSTTSETRNLMGDASNFPGPGVPTLDAGAIQLTFEERIRVINAGFFGQAMFGWKDRYFLTVGTRVDGNSAFGQNFGLQAYPKASLSYVLSDEDFWPQSWGTTRLRSAYGHAGRAPGAFDAVRTWNPVGWGTQVAFLPRNVGNPDLGPERTAELELGGEWASAGGRLSVDISHYRATVSDALFPVRQVPSMGFLGSQLENVGKFKGWGSEISINATAVENWNFVRGLEIGLNVATNRTEVLEMGEATDLGVGGGGRIIVGQPIPVIRQHRLLNPREVAEPIIELNQILGPNNPTLTVGVDTQLRLPRGFALAARGEFKGGHYIRDFQGASLSRGAPMPTCTSAHANLAAGRPEALTAWERLQCIPANYRADYLWFPGDHFKLRELSARAPVPVPGTNQATMTLSARNFWTWKNKDFLVGDPDIGGQGGSEQFTHIMTEHIPAPGVITLSLRVTF
jgi:TonB-dependent starch-binding outer membrane protein SusC